MKKYNLHENTSKGLNFELKKLVPYLNRNKEKASVPHRHSFFQLLWFKNKGKHYIDYEVIEHPENSLFLINQNQVHYFCQDSSNSGYLYHFNEIFISEYNLELLSRFSISIFNEIGKPFIILSEKESNYFDSQTIHMLDEINNKHENYENIITHIFFSLLFRVERLMNEQQSFNLHSFTNFTTYVRFKQLVINCFDQNKSIQNYADELNISTKKLTSITKQYTLLTPVKVIKGLKVLEAKRMLSNENLSIQEIAFSLGFDQPTYFTKFFKKETRYTPKEFKSLHH